MPFNLTNRLWYRSRGGESEREQQTRSNVSRAICTMLSATSTQGIRPENPAAVYPYITLAINFNPFCRESNVL